MHGRPRRRLSLPALIILALAALMLPTMAAAHAELTSSDPTNGSSVSGPLAGPVVLQFSEALQSGSHAELLDPGGAKVADAAIDASNRARMLFTLANPLQPGKYTVQWTSVAADKDVARGQVTFTVVAPTPPPATPTATPAPSVAIPTVAATAGPASPTAVASTSSTAPVATASPTPPGAGAASATDAIIPVVAALALVAIVAFMLLRRGRRPA